MRWWRGAHEEQHLSSGVEAQRHVCGVLRSWAARDSAHVLRGVLKRCLVSLSMHVVHTYIRFGPKVVSLRAVQHQARERNSFVSRFKQVADEENYDGPDITYYFDQKVPLTTTVWPRVGNGTHTRTHAAGVTGRVVRQAVGGCRPGAPQPRFFLRPHTASTAPPPAAARLTPWRPPSQSHLGARRHNSSLARPSSHVAGEAAVRPRR
jgi:hypothetical protein